MRDRTAFAEGLEQLGLGAEHRDEVLRLRDDVAGAVQALDDRYAAIARAAYRLSIPPEAIAIAQQRRSAFQRLNDWFADRRFKVHARSTVELPVPLYVLSAPDVAGCATALWPSGLPPSALEGKLVVHGLGAAGAVGHVTAASGVAARAGEQKTMFLPITISVAEVTLHDAGREIGHGIQVAVAEPVSRLAPCVCSVSADLLRTPSGTLTQTYLLDADTTGDVFGYERIEPHAQNGTKQLRLAFPAFGTEATLAASFSMTAPLVLAIDLAGGHDYDLFKVEASHGIEWRVR